MLVEAIDIIRQLHTGELVTHHGDYFDVDSARIWDVPDEPVPIGVAVGGDGIERLAPLADHLIAVEPDADLVTRGTTPRVRRAIGARHGHRPDPDLLGPDRDAAIARAHEQFRWFGGGWAVNADLPTPAGFAGASQFVRPEDVAESIPCGPDLDAIVEAFSPSGSRLHRHRPRADRRRHQQDFLRRSPSRCSTSCGGQPS